VTRSEKRMMMKKNGSKVIDTVLDFTDLLMMSDIRQNIIAIKEWI
jgi:hypothetical protein